MKPFWITMVVALLCGCAARHSSVPAGSTPGPIDQVAAASIAERVVRERESWRRVVSDARKVEQGWKVFVERRPFKPSDPIVKVVLDERGQVLDYHKFHILE
jgi:hypothetical protein